jgi:hypothetical protein
MEATILLSRALGLCLIIIGAAIILRRRYFLSVFAAHAEQRLVRTVASMIELTVGCCWWSTISGHHCRPPSSR